MGQMLSTIGAGKRQMAGWSSKTGVMPGWYDPELPHVWLPYAQMKTLAPPLPVVRTQGTRIFLADGRELIDGIASWWTACHGYNHPHIRQAVEAQLASMPHVMFGGLVHEQALRLAGRLGRLLPGNLERVFFSDSGSVAVEIALKMATQYWINNGAPDKKRFVAFRGAYHGDTFGAMSVSDLDTGIHAGFAGLLPAHRIVDLPENDVTASALEKVLKDQSGVIAGIIVEPLVQGAGGMKFHDADTLRHLRTLADQHDVLLIFDEVFTGFGRTGKMFACEHANVAPDLLCLAKGITGGYLPLAATLASEEIFSAFLGEYREFKTFFHGHTYTGNPLGCAAALANLQIFEREKTIETLPPRIAYISARLEELRRLVHVSDVRQWGYMVGIELVEDKESRKSYAPEKRIGYKVILEARKRNVMIRPLGDVIALMPPLSISDNELTFLVDIVYESILEVTGD